MSDYYPGKTFRKLLAECGVDSDDKLNALCLKSSFSKNGFMAALHQDTKELPLNGNKVSNYRSIPIAMWWDEDKRLEYYKHFSGSLGDIVRPLEAQDRNQMIEAAFLLGNCPSYAQLGAESGVSLPTIDRVVAGGRLFGVTESKLLDALGFDDECREVFEGLSYRNVQEKKPKTPKKETRPSAEDKVGITRNMSWEQVVEKVFQNIPEGSALAGMKEIAMAGIGIQTVELFIQGGFVREGDEQIFREAAGKKFRDKSQQELKKADKPIILG